MKSVKPEKIAINHDEYTAKHVGITKDGFQFFLTNPFLPALRGNKGCEYIALFKFDKEGNIVDSTIDTLGARGSFSEDDARKIYYDRLEEIDKLKFCRIEVKPFCIKYNGTDFGLIKRVPENEGDIWAVEMMPGNYMAFFEPWDSGEYDT